MAYSDEHLSAYLDGELSEDERREIDQALEIDPELFERLEHLRTVDTVLSDTFLDIADEQIPEQIMSLIRSDQNASKGNVVSLSDRDQKLRFQTPFAMAAAAAIGVFVGAQFLNSASTTPEGHFFAGEVADGTELFQVLETISSQTEHAGITPVLTFASVDGGICREVTSKNERALACRADGKWTIIAVTHEPRQNEAGTYATASSNASIVFDVLSQQLMADAPLSADAEQSLIDQNWRSSN